jgi:hypothetical protein
MLMEEVLRRENMMTAHARVVKNRGAPGVDEMNIEELWGLLPEALGAHSRRAARRNVCAPTYSTG